VLVRFDQDIDRVVRLEECRRRFADQLSMDRHHWGGKAQPDFCFDPDGALN
jgi:hypothetical protein